MGSLFPADKEAHNDEHRRMPVLPKKLALSVALLPLLLSSCVFHTHQRALDMAQEYDAVAELNGAVYQAGNRFYVQGVRTKVRRNRRCIMNSACNTHGKSRSGCHPMLSTAVLATAASHRGMMLPRGTAAIGKSAAGIPIATAGARLFPGIGTISRISPSEITEVLGWSNCRRGHAPCC